MAKAKAKDYLNEVRVIESERTDGYSLIEDRHRKPTFGAGKKGVTNYHG